MIGEYEHYFELALSLQPLKRGCRLVAKETLNQGKPPQGGFFVYFDDDPSKF